MKHQLLEFIETHSPTSVSDALADMVARRICVPLGAQELEVNGCIIASRLPYAFASALLSLINDGSVTVRLNRKANLTQREGVKVYALASLSRASTQAERTYTVTPSVRLETARIVA